MMVSLPSISNTLGDSNFCPFAWVSSIFQDSLSSISKKEFVFVNEENKSFLNSFNSDEYFDGICPLILNDLLIPLIDAFSFISDVIDS